MSEIEGKLAAVSEAVNSLNSRVDALERSTSEPTSSVDFPKIGDANLVIFGDADPSAVPDFAGQFFVDTTGKKAFMAVGTALADWKQIS